MPDQNNPIGAEAGLFSRIYSRVLDWMSSRSAGRIRQSQIYKADMDDLRRLHDSNFAELKAANCSQFNELASLRAEYSASQREVDSANAKNKGLELRLAELHQDMLEKNRQIGALNQAAQSQESRAEELAARVRSFEASPDLELGRLTRESSLWAVIETDADNIVIRVNGPACRYLGMDSRDIKGMNASELAPDNPYFTRYMRLFDATSDRFMALKRTPEPNTFAIGGSPFTLTAHPVIKAERDSRVYKGAFFVIVPYQSRTLLESLSVIVRQTITLPGVVSYEGVLDYVVPLMSSGKRAVYVDFAETELIHADAVKTLAKCYHAITKQGSKCIFTNVPMDVASCLKNELDVSGEYIRSIARRRQCIADDTAISDYNARKSPVRTPNKSGAPPRDIGSALPDIA